MPGLPASGTVPGAFSVPIAQAAAGIPQILSYQGRLADPSGNLLGGNGGTTYYFKFSIWDNATVGSGTKIWPSTSPASTTAVVTSGVFNVRIGDTAAGYPDALTYNFEDSDDVYLQVEVSATAGGTYESISPRQRVTSAAYAINSKALRGFVPSQVASGSNVPVLENGNLTLGGINPQINATSTNALVFQGGAGTGDIQFFGSTNKITSAGSLSISGVLSVASTSVSSILGSLAIGTSTAATLFSVATSTNIFNVLSSGLVGVGTASPSSTLHVVGTTTLTGTSTISGNLLPGANNTYDIGSTSMLWKSLHVASGSIVIHADTTNTNKATLDFSGTVARLITDASTSLQLTTGSNTGIFIASSTGYVGVGTTVPGYPLEVNGG
ncbi:MAG: hypothetical protein Q7R62_03005, partial [bacterium]|nr:hypothetical protein [bacterium]